MMCRGIRGATTAEDNTKEAILINTKELLQKLIKANDIKVEDVASAFFTTTRDLNAEFPAVAARQLGWNNVALICGHEMDVPGALKRVIRILILLNTDKTNEQLVNVYLKEAVNLRSRGVEGNPASR